MVAIPCSGVASTWIETSPMRNRIGATRLLLASEKKGQLIRSWASRGAISPAIGRNRSSCREVKPLAVTDYRQRPAFAGRLVVAMPGPGSDVDRSEERRVG